MYKRAAYTVCTAGFLAHAKTMADSLVRHNPGYTCYIGLVDEVNGRFDEAALLPHIIVPVSALDIPPFSDMRRRYTALELSCALKPWFALHLFKAAGCGELYYFDTDILVFSPLAVLEQALSSASILLTPHITSPLPVDGKNPQEKTLLRTGNFNAGFFAVRKDANSLAFLEWWRRTLVDNCYENKHGCVASDQKWLNYVPLFFGNVHTITHPGCNLAYWNIHERSLTHDAGGYHVNGGFELVFIHLSGYKQQAPGKLSRHQDRYDLATLPAWQQVCADYLGALEHNGLAFFSTLRFAFEKKKRFGLF